MKNLPCICCGKLLSPSFNSIKIDEKSVNREPFLDGMAGTISCGYGSKLDGNIYIVAVCDYCIVSKEEQKLLTYIRNYMDDGDW